VILESEKLLAAVVRSLLSELDFLEIVGVSLGVPEDIAEIDKFHPDVIVVDETFLAKHLDIFMTLMKDYHQIRTIVLHQGNNELDVCDKQVIKIENLSDFIDLI